MGDTRFTLVGVGLIFVGFVVFGAFGSQYSAATIESKEFGDCYQYSEDRPPQRTDCDSEMFGKMVFFVLVAGIIASGGVSLAKGVRGRWDQQVQPEDMVGPGGKPGGRDEDRPGTGESKNPGA